MDPAAQLLLYNAALRILGEGSLGSLTENREPRRLLDSVFNSGGIDYCLQQAYWKFAIRTQQLEFDPSISPSFGYRKAFPLPDDFIRTYMISGDEYFSVPLLEYREEAGYIFCDYETIYFSYISNDSQYGNDTSLWPETFKYYVQSHFAAEIAERLIQNDTKLANAFKIRKTRLMDAKSKDALENPTQFPPVGSWVMSRRSGRVSRRDNGNRGNLYG